MPPALPLPSPAELAQEHARRLEAVRQAIDVRLAAAARSIDAFTQRANTALARTNAPPPSPAPAVSWKVLIHPASGAHFVVRSTVEMPDCSCAFGPTAPDRRPVTFGEATAFANRAFLAQLCSRLSNSSLTSSPLENLSAFAGRLRLAYLSRGSD